MTVKIGLYSKMFTSLLLTEVYGKQYKKDGAEKHAKSRNRTAKKICFQACLFVPTAEVISVIISTSKIPK